MDLRLVLGLDSVQDVVVELLRDRGRGHAIATAYRAQLIDGGAAPSTANLRLSALRSLSRTLIDSVRSTGRSRSLACAPVPIATSAAPGAVGSPRCFAV